MRAVSATRSWFFRVLLGEVWRGGMGRLALAVGLGASALGRASGECKSARCSMHHPKFIWQRAYLPPGLRFIYTDEGLAGLCRLRLSERSTAAGNTAVLTIPTWPTSGGAPPLPPPGMQHSQSHVATCKASGIRHRGLFVCLLLLLPLSSF